MASGDRSRMRAAANSIARGRPSRCRQMSLTAAAFSSVRVNDGCNARERNEENPVRVFGCVIGSDLHGEARFTGPAWAGQREQTDVWIAQRLADRVDLALATDDGSHLWREIRRNRRGGAERRE